MVGAFKNYQEFVRFKPLATAIGLDSKIDFNKIKEAVQKKDPILVLIDVGGSLMYRSGSKLPGVPTSSKTYSQIRMHHHYYRP